MWRGRAHAILYTLNTPTDQRYEHGLAIVESKRWNLPLDRDVNQAASSIQTFYKKEVMRTFIISLLIHTRYPQAGQDLADHLLMEQDKIELHTPSTL